MRCAPGWSGSRLAMKRVRSGPAGEVDAVGELRDLGALRGLAVAAERRLPRVAVEAVVVYGCGDPVV